MFHFWILCGFICRFYLIDSLKNIIIIYVQIFIMSEEYFFHYILPTLWKHWYSHSCFYFFVPLLKYFHSSLPLEFSSFLLYFASVHGVWRVHEQFPLIFPFFRTLCGSVCKMSEEYFFHYSLPTVWVVPAEAVESLLKCPLGFNLQMIDVLPLLYATGISSIPTFFCFFSWRMGGSWPGSTFVTFFELLAWRMKISWTGSIL